MLRSHLRESGTAPDGRLFRGARGGMLSESVYGRTWHTARQAALSPELAATALARRPYDLRHAALSLWLNASGAPAEVAARAGNSARVLHDVYLHCTNGQEDIVSQRIEDALDADASIASSSQYAKASGLAHRRSRPRPCPLFVRERVPRSPRTPSPADPYRHMQMLPSPKFPQVKAHLDCSRPKPTDGRIPPTHSPRTTADGLLNRLLRT
jgi:hypothetical protein